jgi:outer membrane protein OmpA-like peptidoglycan-associated protein
MKYLLVVSILCVSLISSSQIAASLTEVYFDFDSYELTHQSKQNIDNEVKLFNETTEIELIGFSDKTGNSAYNVKLSQKRSHAVELYMISKGVSVKSIVKVEGHGEREEFTQLSKNRVVSISSSTQIVLPNTTTVVSDTEKTVKIEETTLEVQSLSEDVDELEVGQSLAVKGLNFIPGRHVLLRSSEPKLYELLDLLQVHANLKIEIQGHICCSRDGLDGYDVDTDSKMLSLNRAINIYQYLVNQGIDPKRLSYKGFGSDKPLVKEVDEPTRQMNRRVEIMIVEK